MDKFAEGHEQSTSQDVPLLTVVYKPEMSVCVTVYKKRSCRHFFVRWRVEHDKVAILREVRMKTVLGGRLQH